ncbi:MAG TPA: hypothetical protein VGL86_09655 [Polyangia bacterium]
MTLAVGGLLFLLGMRILVMARLTRGVPEILIGAFFLLLGPAGTIFLTAETLLPAHAGRGGALAGVPVSIAMVLACVFTYRTFRQGVAWARALLAVAVAALAASLYVEVHGARFFVDFEPRLEVVLPRAACLGWGAYEAARCYFMMQRRRKFGLGDPVLSNRFLLYAVWTAALALIPAVRTVVRLLELARVEVQWRLPFTLISVGAASVMFVAMFLNFWPPDGYLRWLRQRAAAGATS